MGKEFQSLICHEFVIEVVVAELIMIGESAKVGRRHESLARPCGRRR
jgi:hypothetical protein